MRVSPGRAAVLALALAAAPTAGWWSVRHGWAELALTLAPSAEAARAAVRIEPESVRFAEAYLRTLPSGEPGEMRRAAERLVALNPYGEAAWIELGLAAEAAGDTAAAESHLLEAARISRRYRPRWTLAGFYFRQQNQPRFWWWAREASRLAYDAGTSLYRLAWQVEPDGRALWERLEPRRRLAREGLLRFLMEQPGSPGLAYVAERIGLAADARTGELMLDVCDRLMEVGKLGGSLRVWNRAAAERLIPYPVLEAGRPVRRGFAQPPASRGFDWRITAAGGVSATTDEEQRALRLELDGTQAENFELLWQIQPVEAGGRYRLRWRYRLESEAGAAAVSPGLHWCVDEAPPGTRLLARGEPLTRGGVGEQALAFETGGGTRFVRLALRYDRPLGSVRGPADLWLYSIWLEEAR